MHKVFTFFYGSYINKNVLKEAGITPDEFNTALLPGFDIIIKPYANLKKSPEDVVYGIVSRLTHDELKKLYSHAEDVYHNIYLPEAVLVQTKDEKLIPALCYICHNMEGRKADKNYINKIVQPAKEYGFPDWYIKKLESF